MATRGSSSNSSQKDRTKWRSSRWSRSMSPPHNARHHNHQGASRQRSDIDSSNEKSDVSIKSWTGSTRLFAPYSKESAMAVQRGSSDKLVPVSVMIEESKVSFGSCTSATDSTVGLHTFGTGNRRGSMNSNTYCSDLIGYEICEKTAVKYGYEEAAPDVSLRNTRQHEQHYDVLPTRPLRKPSNGNEVPSSSSSSSSPHQDDSTPSMPLRKPSADNRSTFSSCARSSPVKPFRRSTFTSSARGSPVKPFRKPSNEGQFSPDLRLGSIASQEGFLESSAPPSKSKDTIIFSKKKDNSAAEGPPNQNVERRIVDNAIQRIVEHRGRKMGKNKTDGMALLALQQPIFKETRMEKEEGQNSLQRAKSFCNFHGARAA